jgi:hypothetical protein
MAAFSVILLLAPLARAGVYIPAEMAWWVATPTDEYDKFKEKYSLLKNLGINRTKEEQGNVEANEALQKIQSRYKNQIEALSAKEKAGTLSTQDRLNLSGYHLRLYAPGNEEHLEKAIAVLTTDGRTPVDTSNALLLANLATAISLRQPIEPQRLQEAMDWLAMAIEAWPNASVDCPDPGLLNWFLRAEKLHYRLLSLRYREAVHDASLPAQERVRRERESGVDDLFPVLQKSWSRDGYSAGVLKPRDALEIPAEAPLLVTQLIYWLPHDPRLYWLLAELQNAAQGRFLDTLEMFVQLSNAYHRSLISEHRRVLLQAKQWSATLQTEELRIVENQLFYSLGIPTGDEKHPGLLPLFELPLPMGALPTLNAVALIAAVNQADLTKSEHPPPQADISQTEAKKEPPPAPNARWTLEWNQIIGGFFAGALVTLLGGQQMREFLRRRKERARSYQGHESLPTNGSEQGVSPQSAKGDASARH